MIVSDFIFKTILNKSAEKNLRLMRFLVLKFDRVSHSCRTFWRNLALRGSWDSLFWQFSQCCHLILFTTYHATIVTHFHWRNMSNSQNSRIHLLSPIYLWQSHGQEGAKSKILLCLLKTSLNGLSVDVFIVMIRKSFLWGDKQFIWSRNLRKYALRYIWKPCLLIECQNFIQIFFGWSLSLPKVPQSKYLQFKLYFSWKGFSRNDRQCTKWIQIAVYHCRMRLGTEFFLSLYVSQIVKVLKF